MNSEKPMVAIACGGTGGHLFPGIAVGEELVSRGLDVMLLVSNKSVDQEAVKDITNMEVVSLPSVALQNKNYFSFTQNAWRSYRQVKRSFKKRVPAAVLAMGGFTSAPPVLAGKRFGVPTFLHEANTIPGRANRLLAKLASRVLIHFPETGERLKTSKCEVVGMPVRSDFVRKAAAECRKNLGLNPEQPVLLVMGGSQGAVAINEMMAAAAKFLHNRLPELQVIHFTGSENDGEVGRAYDEAGVTNFVQPFFSDVSTALGAASVIISRAGASSMAEIASQQIPAVLIPYPFAADDHQFFNARAFEKTGAARVLPQDEADADTLVAMVSELLENEGLRTKYINALQQWGNHDSAQRVAGRICDAIQFSKISESTTSDRHHEEHQMETVLVGK